MASDPDDHAKELLAKDVAWVREHLWELHAPAWESRIARILTACEAMSDHDLAAGIARDMRVTWPPDLPVQEVTDGE